MERLGDEFESILESASSSIDFVTDAADDEETTNELESSILCNDVVDFVLEGNEVDKEVEDVADGTDVIGYVSDDDIEKIAKGKKLVDDDPDTEADKDVKEYANELVENGTLTNEEVNRLLSGESIEEVIFAEGDEVSDEPDEIFGDEDDSEDDDDMSFLDISNTDPNSDEMERHRNRHAFHDEDDDDDEDEDEEEDDVKFTPYEEPDDDDEEEDDDDDDSEDDDEDDDDEDEEKYYKEDSNMFDDDELLDEEFETYDDDESVMDEDFVDEEADDGDGDLMDYTLEMDLTLPNSVSGSEEDYSDDNGAGINSKEKSTGFLKGMPDIDEQKYGHPKKDKDILSTVPDLFGEYDDPNIDDMTL